MSDHESRIRTLERARKEIEDSLVVMAELEARQSRYLKQQAQSIEELRQRDDEQRKLNEETDRRISRLVSAAGELIARIGPPQAQA